MSKALVMRKRCNKTLGWMLQDASKTTVEEFSKTQWKHLFLKGLPRSGGFERNWPYLHLKKNVPQTSQFLQDVFVPHPSPGRPPLEADRRSGWGPSASCADSTYVDQGGWHQEFITWGLWKLRLIKFWVLVGGFNHLEKYESQWEGLSHILLKINNVWNHQPD